MSLNSLIKRPICRALISVSDKTGIVDFATALSALGIQLISTGGTAELLSKKDVKIQRVSSYTGFPEIMGGRLKTLHPKIHGGILARRGQDESILEEHGIEPIDMVVVNLYPFSQAIAETDCSLEHAIENIDIGGPTMIRSAAKNHQDVAVIVHFSDYSSIIDELNKNKKTLSHSTRFSLATKAFQHTAAYDSMISHYFDSLNSSQPFFQNQKHFSFPDNLHLQYIKKQDMRYGENNHQKAAFYVEKKSIKRGISNAQQLQGKPLSYNNINDADTALECVKEFTKPACVIVKHANPCAVAIDDDSIFLAYEKAYASDSLSAFGGIIAFNRTLDLNTVDAIIHRQFVEVIIAPAIKEEAKFALAKKPNVRVLIAEIQDKPLPSLHFKSVQGGLLVQENDLGMIAPSDLKIVSTRQPTKKEQEDALFAWKVVKYVKSNAIVYATKNRTIGIGAGQMSRVYSAKIAGMKAVDAGLTLEGSSMASDAFLPFPDSVDEAAALGVTCIIQPGGSINDAHVIARADQKNLAMILTNMRHFRH
ncbi:MULTISPECIES: bifunctional phosphoribosylaminoimidazolecarboxamide formyltransferase/IMP cyclohydrolase [Candidatus Williamhamiltonella]|uniref:Bifunctional purine biosynthesis protein PurH n=1 Tax=Candidatus Williamhamiltonella defendens TaxID=138072 RepID=A0A2D3TDS1_9ENTR|nr:bifunctional phosphoribosylaminoimidazolecarboxamide formyltransferase/IMP cyclohydrolase [Candidatus Hamiltonella defensa]ATW33952.1 bifunctional phosphoribosylaminoimidazolecarboxamide formyltransferase/IMP cyclohydrolase [Candidatus Hamiltonella defensa]